MHTYKNKQVATENKHCKDTLFLLVKCSCVHIPAVYTVLVDGA